MLGRFVPENGQAHMAIADISGSIDELVCYRAHRLAV